MRLFGLVGNHSTGERPWHISARSIAKQGFAVLMCMSANSDDFEI